MPSENNVELPTSAVLQDRANQVYAAMAILAGMQLDVFTQLKDGPLEVSSGCWKHSER
jgi:hypothetical protein